MEKLKTKTMGYIAAGVVALGAVGAGLGITQPWKHDEEPEPPAPPQEVQTSQPGRPDGYLTVGGKQIPCTLHEGDGWSILVPQEWRIDGDETHLAAVPELGSSVELAVGPGSLEKGPRGVSCYRDDDGTMNRIFFLGEGEKQLEVSCRAPEDQWEDYKFTLAAMAKSFTVDGEQPFQAWSPLPEEPQWQMADGVTVLWLDKDGVALDGEAALEGVCDEAETLFGIRTVTADAVHGLRVNGRTVKLKGGCIHHDNGLLGAVSLRDSEYRKLGLLKEAGFNAVRLAHNPGSGELLEACDRLGLYVFDEAFDAWGHSKRPGDYSQFFHRDWKEDMESFILRDRNHPCILIWSTGNEVEERGGMGNGYTLAEELAAYVRSLDSTRLVSNGLCSMWSGLDDASVLEQMAAKRQGNAQNEDSGEMDGAWEDRTESFCNCLDVVGYNYMDSHYEYAGQRYPERVILGTESFPNQFDKVWELVERLPYVIGDFTWTAVDYIGEAGIGKSKFFEQGDPELAKGPWAISSHVSEYPWRLANDADITIGGRLTPQGVYRKIVWGSSQTGLYVQHPRYHGMEEVVSNWGWNQMTDCWNYEGYAGRPVKVYVYSAAKEVELFLNGKSLGRAAAGKENRFCAVFETVYEPGVLRAVSLDGDREVSGAEIATTGAPASIRLTADKTRLKADGEGLSYVAVEILDEDGNVVKDGEIQLEASLEAARAQYHSLSPVRKILGEEGMKAMMAGFGSEAEKEAPDASACLAGFGSDNPVTEDNYTVGKCRSYQGRALAVVRAGQIAGKALLRVAAPGLGEASLEIAVEA